MNTFVALVIAWSVIDGDTIDVSARIWPGLVVEERVRLNVVDTPELTGPPCERGLAILASDATRRYLQGATAIRVVALERDSFGRILGHVLIDGQDLGERLMAEGHARKYTRGKTVWC